MNYIVTLPKARELINSLLIVLSEKEKFIIEHRFSLNGNERMTLERIGNHYNVTRERIRQIEKNALKKLSRNVNNTQLRYLTELAVGVLQEQGGLMAEDLMTSMVIKYVEETDNVDISSLKLTIDLDKQIVHEHNTIRFRPYWRLSDTPRKMVKSVCNAAVKELQSRSEVLGFRELAVILKEKYELTGLTTQFVASSCELDRKLKTVDNKGVGLASWREINPKTLRDKIFYVFNQIEKPLHYIDIANRIMELGFDDKSVNVQAVHNELIRFPEFILIGRGIYALKNWGYNEGTVADVIKQVLQEHGELSRQDVIDKVLECRQVKKITIMLNLKNKPMFEKTENNTYKLSSATA